jgi:hypothetical protein
MTKYLTDTTSPEAREFLLLAQAYEDSQVLVQQAIEKVEGELYKRSDSGFHTPESITIFKTRRSEKLASNYAISEARKKVAKASRDLDQWLTPFVVNMLDNDEQEFIICGHSKQGILLARINKEYHIIPCSGNGTMRNQLSIYRRTITSH